MANKSLGEYADDLFGGEDDLLRQMRDEAAALGIPAIQVPQELGRLLGILLAHTGTRSVLEIGTLFGYSAILMARALPPGGRITSLEVNPTHAATARANFERAGVADRVDVLEGEAVKILPSLVGRSFDLVFIDADKRSYPDYLEWALKLTHPSSLIVADNVWRGGSLLDPEAGDADTQGLAQFNRKLARERRLVSTFVPTRDGADAVSVSVVRAER